MIRNGAAHPPGRLVWITHTSRRLQGNPWNDPVSRPFPVWLPPQYDDPVFATRRFPVFYGLAAYLGAGPGQVNWQPFNETLPERIARLLAQGALGPLIAVFPDCYTALGGNQYLNSSALGRYGDYLALELVPFIDNHFRTFAQPQSRAVFGKSSGGYGALRQAVDYPGVWGAVANHSGDAAFDIAYRGDWPDALDVLARHRPLEADPAHSARLAAGQDDGRIRNFLQSLERDRRPSGAESHALMLLCMAASYDPDPRSPNGFRVPFHLDDGTLLNQRWARWLNHDPVRFVARGATALRSLRSLYIDCGQQDQYHLHYGARQLSGELTRLGIPHHHEAFEGTHSGIDYRLDRSLPLLYAALQA